jgi:hypothetical protein
MIINAEIDSRSNGNYLAQVTSIKSNMNFDWSAEDVTIVPYLTNQHFSHNDQNDQKRVYSLVLDQNDEIAPQNELVRNTIEVLAESGGLARSPGDVTIGCVEQDGNREQHKTKNNCSFRLGADSLNDRGANS